MLTGRSCFHRCLSIHRGIRMYACTSRCLWWRYGVDDSWRQGLLSSLHYLPARKPTERWRVVKSEASPLGSGLRASDFTLHGTVWANYPICSKFQPFRFLCSLALLIPKINRAWLHKDLKGWNFKQIGDSSMQDMKARGKSLPGFTSQSG